MNGGGSRPVRAAAIAAAALACWVAAAAAAAPATAASKPRPNVILIVTDDQTAASFNTRYMPRTVKQIAGRGTSFANAVVSTPVCCPSRAQMLTGQYAHNNGVRANNPGYGLLEDKRNVLPTWLGRAGYRTLHVGKYLNGYAQVKGPAPAPGWDRWLSLTGTSYSRPTFSIDGKRRAYDRYLTGILGRMSARLVSRYARDRRPFYLQVDHFAPHVDGSSPGRCDGAAVPDPADGDLFASEQAPRPPSFGEPDVGDKPEFIQKLPGFDQAQIDEVDRLYSCAVGSLAAVDRAVAELMAALRRSGELGRTMIVFTSDNGYAFGEHRFPNGKGLAYDEQLRVPLAIRPPRGFPSASRSGAVDPAVVANVDLAPTILALAGAEPCIRRGCRRLDGRSLVGVLRGREPGWAANRAITTSFDINAETYKLSCGWEGYWTPQQSVIHHTLLPAGLAGRCQPADVFESYDLGSDPFQLDSVPPSQAQIERLEAVRDCSGIRGRDKPLPERPFCE
jgi:arylsulfatase A-like enzyme